MEYENINIYQYLRPRRICLCIGLSEKDILEAIDKYKITNFEDLQNITQCSTNCGTCEDTIRNILLQYLKKLSSKE